MRKGGAHLLPTDSVVKLVCRIVDNADLELRIVGWCKHQWRLFSIFTSIILYTLSHSMGLKSEDSYAAQLQAILRIAHDLKEVAAVSLPPSHPPSIPSCGPAIMDSINLPAPRPLFPLLIEAGFSHEIATAASSMYLQRAEELRHHIQKSIMATWLKLADLPVSAPALSLDLLITKVVSTSTEMYLRRLERWKEEIVHRIKQISNAPPKVAPRNAFNHVGESIIYL